MSTFYDISGKFKGTDNCGPGVVYYAYVMSNHFVPYTHYANHANVVVFAYKSFLELLLGCSTSLEIRDTRWRYR